MDILGKKINLVSEEGSENFSIFDKYEEIEVYQLRLGLKHLCQNTLFYYYDVDGNMLYRTKPSPNAERFYSPLCNSFRKSGVCNDVCDKFMYEVAEYIFGNVKERDLECKFQWLSYDDGNHKNWSYLRYVCKHTHLYKFAFPLYAENKIVGIIFTGQFGVSGNFPEINSQDHKLSRILKDKYIVNNSHQKIPPEFANLEELMGFVIGNLIPEIIEINNQIARNLEEKWERSLRRTMSKQIKEFKIETAALFSASQDCDD